MTLVVVARARFEQAQKDAKATVDEQRAAFGRTIKVVRDRDGVAQEAIAEALSLTREQVRRYERYYEDWSAKHGREPAG